MKRVFLFILVLVIANCGLHAAQPRISGGDTINITEAPWQVQLCLMRGEHECRFHCGGIIIAPNFILTAKHSVEWHNLNHLRVIAGVTCQSEIDSSNVYYISQIILHPDLGTDVYVDAALLQLSRNIIYDSNKQPVNFSSSADNTLYDIGNLVRASGWGHTIPGISSLPDCLQAVDLNIISNQDASVALQSNPFGWDRDLFDHEMAAAGSGNIRQGGCSGDSGGPLTIMTATNEPVLIGIVKGGASGCLGSNEESPSIFVRVSHIRDWIESVICATPVYFTDETVIATTETVTSCGDIYVENVEVKQAGQLILEAEGNVRIEKNFKVELGSTLKIK